MCLADKFPESLPEFQRMFPDDAACAKYLEAIRWRLQLRPHNILQFQQTIAREPNHNKSKDKDMKKDKETETVSREANPAFDIMVATDACEDRRYDDAKAILESVPIVLIRTRDAGVHFGKLEFICNAQHGCYRVVLGNAKRIWSWQGANTLNEISTAGFTSAKVSEAVDHIVIPQVIEVIPCTPKAIAVLSKAKWQ